MPFVIGGTRRGRRVLAAAVGITLLGAGSAQAASTASNPYDCTPEANLSRPFSSWGDLATYTPLPGGNMESGAAGWTLSGGATTVAGNEPWYVQGANQRFSLRLPAGSSAVSAPLCIDPTYPFYRLFARNAGNVSSSLKMEVLFLDSKGKVTSTKATTYTPRSTAWAPTGQVGINVFTPKTTVSAAPVAFRFTPQGGSGSWQIDDVLVDPYARR
jgi:hypothetical protein